MLHSLPMEPAGNIPFLVARSQSRERRAWTDDLTSDEPLPATVASAAPSSALGTRVTFVANETTDDE
jgi:hypothetical protein